MSNTKKASEDVAQSVTTYLALCLQKDIFFVWIRFMPVSLISLVLLILSYHLYQTAVANFYDIACLECRLPPASEMSHIVNRLHQFRVDVVKT